MFPSLQLADWKAHKNTGHLNVEMEAALDAEQKAWTKQKAVSAAGHQFFTGGSSSPQKAIIFAVIWGVLLSFYGAIILATFHQRSQVVQSVLCRKKATINWQKVQEFEKADENTLMAYVRKRIPCSCLDKKYKEVKRIVTKMGTCNNPHCSLQDRQVELRTMKECSYCCRAFYCSRRCS